MDRHLNRATGLYRSTVIALSRLPRGAMLALALGVGIFAIAFFSIVFPENSRLGVFWLDKDSNSSFLYPFTIQNIMHLMLFVALGELFVRSNVAAREHAYLADRFLPEDETTVLRIKDLGAFRQRVIGRSDGDNGFLPYLIDLCVLQLQASRSVDQTVGVLNSSLELMAHRLDLRYALLRYISWGIPTVGFIGTVVGIAGALGFINPDHMELNRITSSLAVAFNTTIIALLYSAIVVFVQTFVQKREELALNAAGNYCLKNLINRMYLPKEQVAA